MESVKSNIQKMFVSGESSVKFIAVAFLLFFTTYSTVVHAQSVQVGINVTPPFWAPPYNNVEQVQYYYLPEIESYYDVWNHQFVYMENGNWIFGPVLPPQYAWYDLNRGSAIVLGYHVHRPWMHFHYYASHYPRHYYRDVYRGPYYANRPMHHGFNEYGHSPIYRSRTAEPGRRTAFAHQSQRMEHSGRNGGGRSGGRMGRPR